MQIEYSASELLSIYNTVVTRAGLPRLGANPGTMQQLIAFGEWCRAHDVEPTEWIMDRHQQFGWKRRVPVKQLASLNVLATHRLFGARKQAAVLAQTHAADKITHNATLFGEELRPIGEVMKRQLLIDPESCLIQMDLTGGWNPRSEMCVECPVADRCIAALPPEVAGRRRAGVGRG